MSIYRLKVICDNAQVEVVAKNGVIIARELDRYLENFLQRPIAFQYCPKPDTQTSPVPEEPKDSVEYIVHEQNQELSPEVKYTEPERVSGTSESLSLSEFIAINKRLDIFSEFIISAYYIKKVLGENSFTLKFLNSKFYPATGTLIDLSIVEDAKNQNLINCREEDGATRYTLSDAGEEFFLNQLRG